MYCEKCGANIAESSKFCEKCGAKQSRPEQAPNINMDYGVGDNESSNRSESQSFEPQSFQPRNQGHSPEREEVLSTKEYIKMYLLMMLPILNIVLLIKWGFGEGINENKRNLSKAMLVFMAVSIVPAIIAVSVIMPSMMSLYSY